MKRIEDGKLEKPQKKVKKVTKKPVTKKETTKNVALEAKKKVVKKTIKKPVIEMVEEPIQDIWNEPIIEIEEMVKPIEKGMKHLWKEFKKVMDKNAAFRFVNVKYRKKEKKE